MKNSYLSAIGKQFMCALTLGSGVVLLSIPSVADASPASSVLKIISKIGKGSTKMKPIVTTPTRATGPVARSGGVSSDFIRKAGYGMHQYNEREKKEREKRESQNKGLFNR